MIQNNLILFFSFTGTCKRAAALMSHEIGGDIISVKTKGIGPFKIFSHIRRLKKDKPIVILPEDLDLKKYDTICIGGPVWYEKPAPALEDMVKQLDLKGKKVILFLIGSEWGASILMLKEMVKKKGAKILSMMTFKSSDSNNAMTEIIRNHVKMMQ